MNITCIPFVFIFFALFFSQIFATTWTLSGVTFDDGGIATGSFSIDPNSLACEGSFSISVSGGSSTYPPITYNPSDTTCLQLSEIDYAFLLAASLGPRYLRLHLDSTLPSVGGTVNINTNSGNSYECLNCEPLRYIVSGSLTSPSTIITTQPLTTAELTTQPLTTQPLTTQPLTTQPLTTQPLTTQQLTTQPLTTQPLTTQPLTTQPLTTQPLTTQPLTTQPLTTSVPTASFFCATADPNEWNYGVGYYCSLSGGFFECFAGITNNQGYEFPCPAGTSCQCGYGIECSVGGTQSPCTNTP